MKKLMLIVIGLTLATTCFALPRGGSRGGSGGGRGFGGGGHSARGFSGGGHSARGFSGGSHSARGFSGGSHSTRGFSGGGYSARGFNGGGYSARGFNGGGYSGRGYGGQFAGQSSRGRFAGGYGGFRGGYGWSGFGFGLVSPLPHGPTGMAITRTRPTTPLIPTLTTITRLHTIRMHTIRLRTMGVRQEAWVSSWEVLGEAAPLPAAVSGAISAGADLGNGKRSAFLSRNGSFCYEIVAVSDSSGPALRDRPPQASGEWALTPSRRSGTPLSLASRRGDRAEGRATRPHVLRRGLTFLLEIQCNPHTIHQDGALAY